MEKINLGAFRFSGSTLGEIPDLRQLDPADKAEMLMLPVRKLHLGKTGLEYPGRTLEREFEGVAKRGFGIHDIAILAALTKGRRGQGQAEHHANQPRKHDLGTHPTPSLSSKKR